MELAVISGKGGTGKSSISAAFATLDGKVMLADCDVDAANLYLLFNPTNEEKEVFVTGEKAFIDYSKCSDCGICIDYCRFGAISRVSDKVTISEVRCDGCVLCARICPARAIEMVPNDKSLLYSGTFRNGKMIYGRLAPGEENTGKLVNKVREKAKAIASENNLDTIILDGPPGIGCPVISTITGVDTVVIVTEPTVSGLSDMERTVEIVRKFGIKAFVVINKYDLNLEMSKKIEEWCTQQGIDLPDHLPFDPAMVEAMVRGLSIIEFDNDLIISKEIRKIWNKILNEK